MKLTGDILFTLFGRACRWGFYLTATLMILERVTVVH